MADSNATTTDVSDEVSFDFNDNLGIDNPGISEVADGDKSAADKTAAEELFEVLAGKDQSGNQIVHKLSKADLLKQAGIGLTAQQRIEATKQQREQLEQMALTLQDPTKVFDALKALGHNTDELIDKVVDQRIKDALEDPGVKEARTNAEELERYRKQDAEAKKAQEEARLTELSTEFSKRVSTKIDETLAAANLKNTQGNRAAVARYLSTLIDEKDEAGNMKYPRPLQMIPVEKLVEYHKRKTIEGIETLLEGADEDGILATLPKGLVDRIAKAVTKELSGKSQGKSVDQAIKNPASNKKDKNPMTTVEREALIKNRVAAAQEAWERQQRKA